MVLPFWLLAAGLGVIGLFFLTRGGTTAAVVMIAAAALVLVAGLVGARALSGSRADREG